MLSSGHNEVDGVACWWLHASYVGVSVLSFRLLTLTLYLQSGNSQDGPSLLCQRLAPLVLPRLCLQTGPAAAAMWLRVCNDV